jgi:hypothetical protein
MSKKAFNTAVIALAKYDRYFLTKHFHSSQLSEAEREAFVPDGAGGFFVAINPRDEAPIITVADTVPEKKSKCGARPGAGRPIKKARLAIKIVYFYSASTRLIVSLSPFS